MLPLPGSPRLTILGREVRLGTGYADLLAVESSGRLVIIEVKLAGTPITPAAVRRSGEPDKEALRQRAAHAGPIADDTLLYRVKFHLISPPAPSQRP